MRSFGILVCFFILMNYHRTMTTCQFIKGRAQYKQPFQIEVINAIENAFIPDCIWVAFEGEVLFKPPTGDPVKSSIIIQEKSFKHLHDWNEFISSGIFREISCVTTAFFSYPSEDIFMKINSFHTRKIRPYIIFSASDVMEAEKFLLHPMLIDEENVAAIILDTKLNWIILIRRLFTPSGDLKIEYINKWVPESGFQSKEKIFFDQMSNFNGKMLRGTTLDFMPFTDYDVTSDFAPVKPKVSLDFFLLNVISDTLNFTYEMYKSTDGKWGTFGPNGQWQGVVGDISRHVSNFSLVLSITSERLEWVDFSQIYFFDPITFVTSTKRPKATWNKIIIPFQGEVWAMTVITICLSCILYLPLLKRGEDREFINVNLTRSAMQMIGSFLSQNLPYIPKNALGRMFLGTWLIFSLLMTTYYKTSLIAVLALPPIPPIINTFRELSNSELKYGMIDAKGSEYEMFSSSTIELQKLLFSQMVFLSSDESMKRVSEGTNAYIYFKSNLEIIIASQFTDKSGFSTMHIAKEEVFPGGYAWAFPKGSPYLKSFDKVISRCTEAGLLKFWLQELKRLSIIEGQKSRDEKGIQSETQSDSTLTVLTLNHLQGAFAALLLGYIFALVIFILEYLISFTIKLKH